MLQKAIKEIGFVSTLRFPQRDIKLVGKKILSSALLRLQFEIFDLIDLPASLTGQHVKLIFPNRHRKTYTVSYHDKEKSIIEVDMVNHLKGFSSRWAQDASLGSYLKMDGPKRRPKELLNVSKDYYTIYSDLSGFGSIRSFLLRRNSSSRVVCHLMVDNETEIVKDFCPDSNVELNWRVGSIDLVDEIKYMNNKTNTFLYIIGEKEQIENLKVTVKRGEVSLPAASCIKAYWRKS